jgi:hypothetical protein
MFFASLLRNPSLTVLYNRKLLCPTGIDGIDVFIVMFRETLPEVFGSDISQEQWPKSISSWDAFEIMMKLKPNPQN